MSASLIKGIFSIQYKKYAKFLWYDMQKSHLTPTKIVVKIGSESIGWNPEESNRKLENLARDIAELKKRASWRVYIVTSGAVLHGKIALWMKPDADIDDREKQKLASIGQGYLIQRWNEALRPHGLFGAQIMTTHALLWTDTGIRNGFLSSLEYFAQDEKVVPIINENDPITPEEIKEIKFGADNDQNALLIATLTRSNYLAIITNTDGVRRVPSDPSSRIPLLRARSLDDGTIQRMTENGRSGAGTGGMGSKLQVMREAVGNHMKGYIYDGVHSSLIDFVNSEDRETELIGGTVIQG